MSDKIGRFCSSNKQETNPLGKALKALSVGAKTVKGPCGSDMAPTKSVALNAATNVEKIPAFTAVVGISTNDEEAA
eukprot:CAMPEP_0170940658 /NCGR_PEP_ID=MMETSP0735-20130129/22863_1 /TAXON_ID=186038 /ORGANISM="Fragilariopsis kerguelensis, Strain L26-C5" /LENGTH=75 /DNA_ID=CAMNT_0011346677 /DNA_START=174 /DNA_END=401 /DNA_ORIENTATION=+